MKRTVLIPQFPYFCILVLTFDQVVVTNFTPILCSTRFSIEHFAFTLPHYSSRKDGVEKRPIKFILHLFFLPEYFAFRMIFQVELESAPYMEMAYCFMPAVFEVQASSLA